MPPEGPRDELLELRFVGPATADLLADADVTADDVMAKRVSHSDLVDVGVNPGVAARIRREHSLQWSFEGGKDLDRRAEQVRGLNDDERAWVAASYGDDADASTDGSGDATAAESAWRERSAESPDGTSSAESDDEQHWRERSWPSAEGESSGATDDAELAWRERSRPTPVTAVEGVEEADARLLARAGITSVRSLATAHVERVADSLGVEPEQVRFWKEDARDHDE